MKRSIVKAPWIAGVVVAVALPAHAASRYSEMAASAESSMSWGLYGRAIDIYESVLADDGLSADHAKARLELMSVYLARGDLGAAREQARALKGQTLSSKEAKKLKKMEKKIKSATKQHKFAARAKLSWYRDTNASIASAGVGKPAASFGSDEDEEGDDEAMGDEDMEMDDFADFDDALEDIAEATEETQDDVSEGEDLEESAEADSGAGGDEDGTGAGGDGDSNGAGDAAANGADDANAADDEVGISPRAAGGKPASKKVVKTGDHRVQLGFAAAYGYLLNDNGDRWNLLLNTTRTDQVDIEKQDSRTVAVSTGPTLYIPQISSKVSAAATYVQLYKPQEFGGYQNDSAIYSLGLAHKLNKNVDLGIKYNYETREFNDDEVPELDVDTLKLGVKLRLTKNDNLDFSYSPKVEDNSNPTKDKDADGWSVSYARKLPMDSFLVLSYADKTTELVNDPKGTESQDKKTGLTLGHKLNKKVSLSLAVEKKERLSNLPNKDSDGQSAVLSGTYSF